MKKFIILTVLTGLFNTIKAEDIVQVVPFKTTAGVTSDYFFITMNNPSMPIRSMDFVLKLPEGMELYNTTTSIKLLDDRNKYYDEEEDDDIIAQVVAYEIHEEGNVNVVTYSNTNSPYAGTSGNIMKVRYKTSSSMAPGIYSIQILDMNMASNNFDAINPENSSSYFVVSDTDASIQDENGFVDLSALEGYIPTFVVDAINEEIDDETTGIDISNATNFGKPLNISNPNALVFVSEETNVSNLEANLVKNGVCSSLNLIDKRPFYTSKKFTTASASYTRSMEGHEWGTICLPFSATSSNANVYRLKSVSADVMSFEPTESSTISANTPYVIKKTSDETDVTFTASNVEVAATPAECKAGTGAPNWTLIGTTIDLNFTTNLSGLYFINNDQFWQASNSLHVAPFRAYFDGPAGSSQAKFRITEETNGIETIENEAEAGVIYDLQGRTVKVAQAGQIYVQGAKKFVVK